MASLPQHSARNPLPEIVAHTANINDRPNSLHVSGDRGYWMQFGDFLGCRPVNIAGIGHHPHIEARFRFGPRIELDRATAAAFARDLAASVAQLPELADFSGVDLSGAATDLDVGGA